MTAMSWSVPKVLCGNEVCLEPLEARHAAEFAVIADRETFRYMLKTPEPLDEAAFHDYIAERIAPGSSGFAVRQVSTGKVVGHSSYLDMSEPHRHVEIGHTWYVEAARGTRINPECKLLLLENAFEQLNCVRVQLKCDARNTRSRAAIAKLGALFEGIQRSNMVLPDGSLRDTAFYSIIRPEWPVVKAGLLARLK